MEALPENQPTPDLQDRDPSSDGNTSSSLFDGQMVYQEPETMNEEDRKRYEASYRTAVKRARYYKEPIPEELNRYKPSDAGIAYRQNLAGTRKPNPNALSRLDSILSRINARQQPGRQQAFPYDEAKIILDRLYEVALARRNRNPIWSDDTASLAKGLLKYFIGDPDSPFQLTRGLMLYGDPSVGKSDLFKRIEELCDLAPIREMQFSIVSAKAILTTVNRTKSLAILDHLERGNLMIDDFGEEDKIEKVWGVDKNPMDLLLSARYDHYIKHGQLTHVTSNLEPMDLEKRYGTRLFDRLGDMMEPIVMTGQNLRLFDEPDDNDRA